jgi:hypothetical protein
VTDAGGDEFPCPSFTTREKTNVLVVDGAVNVGFTLEGFVSVTAGPEVWLHA